MKPLPSTSAATSTATSSSIGGSGGGPTSTDGVREAVPSTSGPATAVQKETFLNRASLRQCEQLFRSTCRVKLQRCQVPISGAENNAIPVTEEGPANLTTVQDESRYSSTEDEIKALPDSPASPPLKKNVVSVTKKKRGESVSNSNRKSPARCQVCGKTLHSKEYLKLHMRKHNGVKRYCCGSCGKSFWNSAGFSSHKKAKAKRNGVCTPKINKKRPKGAWKCKLCQKVLKSPGSYLPHIRNHRAGKPYKCVECGKVFRSEKTYLPHIRGHKGDIVKPFKCGDCGKEFAKKCYLSDHLWTHGDVWRYTCVFCQKGFHQQCNLFRHIRLHTEEKPYFCVVEDCGESFRHLDNLKRHRRMIHLKKY